MAAIDPIEYIHQRVDVGEPMPAGQCPECGGVCYPSSEEKTVKWFARGGGIAQCGPFDSQAEAAKAMRLRGGGFPSDVFVWPEESEAILNHTFRGLTIPNHMMDIIRRYIDEHILPGQFLQAIISNDLLGAVRHADDKNLTLIAAYVNYFYNEAPASCWGSRKAMKHWSESM